MNLPPLSCDSPVADIHLDSVLAKDIDSFAHVSPLVRDKCSKWASLRNSVASQQSAPLLKEYIALLQGALRRLPLHFSGHFPWSSGNVALADELGLMVYYYGTIAATPAFKEPRSSPDSIKRAAAAFQEAAGIFACSRFLDIQTPPACEAASALCLAMAQECSWQKAVADKLPNSLIARIAMQTHLLYNDALAKGAPHESRIKSAHFYAVSQFRKAQDDIEKSNNLPSANVYIARLNAARDAILNALTISPLPGTSMRSDIDGLLSRIQADIARVSNDISLLHNADPTPSAHFDPIAPAPIAKLPSHSPFAPEDPFFVSEIQPPAVADAILLFDNRRSIFLSQHVSAPLKALQDHIRDTIHSAPSCAVEKARASFEPQLAAALNDLNPLIGFYSSEKLIPLLYKCKSALTTAHSNCQSLLQSVSNDIPQRTIDQRLTLSKRADQLQSKLTAAKSSDAILYDKVDSAARAIVPLDNASLSLSHESQRILEDLRALQSDNVSLEHHIMAEAHATSISRGLHDLVNSHAPRSWHLSEFEPVIQNGESSLESLLESVSAAEHRTRSLCDSYTVCIERDAASNCEAGIAAFLRLAPLLREGFLFYDRLYDLIERMRDASWR